MFNHDFHDLQGERKNQLLLLCNRKGEVTGQATREECHKGNGLTHLAFMAFVFDKKGEIILTRRSVKKSLWSNFWDASAVSHVLAGENPEGAAKRRAREELGIEADFRTIGSFYYSAKHDHSAENEYCYCLIGKTDQHISPNPVEIGEIRSVTIENLKKEIKEDPAQFTPWLIKALQKFKIE